jgi:predicted cobalt transporter CbtA
VVRSLLIRGMLAGVLAGLLATLFAFVFGEPSIDWAIAFEDHAAKMAGESEAAEIVPRSVQATVGLLTGITVTGAALGGVFGIAYAFALGRLGRVSPAATALLLALAGFVAIALVPQLKYPANPPAVGSADTIGVRTGLYFSLLGLSVFAAVLATAFGRAVASSRGPRIGVLAGAALYVAAIGLVLLAMPSVSEVPEGFSTAVLWKFRAASLGVSAVLWGTLGLVFYVLARTRRAGSARRAIA